MPSSLIEPILLISLLLFIGAACWRYGVGLLFEMRGLQRSRELERLVAETKGIVRQAAELDLAYREQRQKADAMRRETGIIKRQVADLARNRFTIVQPLGRPAPERRCFVFELLRTDAPGARQPPGQRPLADPRFWLHRSYAEVWSEDARTAARLVELTFDARSGFRRSSLLEERAFGR
ncbi:hypothetical protein [Rhodospirillum centenum]|uniref:Uncharacterized protein n=1 Tax=Rhodospirillum centenum (strain ATCC 51521 / SW) TaxID=414684 RepID=B6IWT0_RHOCS|nr:hypothetical protein [Rhodospirillum centenum]ACJ00754.1 hypothetical protein RC1_3394 [Rhodospirillum centenum SW]